MIIDFDEYFKNFVYEPIDLCAIYEPMFEPPADFIAERPREHEPQNPFSCTVTRKIGNTWYSIETECAGREPLNGIIRRMIFSGQEAI